MLVRFLRLRPFLWPVPPVIAAYIGTLWLENGSSYDDGGLGALVSFFAVIAAFAGIVVIDLLTMMGGSLHHATGAAAVILSVVMVIAACLPYLIADRIAIRWVASRAEGGDPSLRWR